MSEPSEAEYAREQHTIEHAGDPSDGGDSLRLDALTTDEYGLIPCPDPECEGHVVEVDVAVRWNALSVEDGAVFASTDGQFDFTRREEDGFICTTCLRPVVSEALETADITYT